MSSRTKTPSRLLLTVVFAISAMLLGIIGAVAAGTGTVAPPPKIAFVASNITGSPDALTVGPMAGRLGAPLFITNKESLGESTKDALVAYGADLIIVAGGPGSVTDAVLTQIAAATGKTIEDIADTPSDGIVRVSGSGRDQTAAELAKLLDAYNPKFLPTDATAADADLLDGKDSTAFLGKTEKAADADKLDGIDSAGFVQSSGQMRVATFNFRSATDGTLQARLFSNTFRIQPGSAGTGFVVNYVDLPLSILGTPLEVVGYEYCYENNGSTLLGVTLTVFNGSATGLEQIATASDPTDYTDDACRTLSLPSPTAITATSVVMVQYQLDVTATSFDLNTSSLVLQSP